MPPNVACAGVRLMVHTEDLFSASVSSVFMG